MCWFSSAKMKRPPHHLLVKRLHNTEYRDNNVDGAVALIPQVIELVHGSVDVAFETCSNHGLHCDWMWLVAHFEDVVARYETEPRPRGLQVVDSLTHVPFGSEDEGLKTFITVLNLQHHKQRGVSKSEMAHLFHLADLQQAL